MRKTGEKKFFFFFFEKEPLYVALAWPRTCYLDQAGLELIESVPLLQGFKEWASIPRTMKSF